MFTIRLSGFPGCSRSTFWKTNGIVLHGPCRNSHIKRVDELFHDSLYHHWIQRAHCAKGLRHQIKLLKMAIEIVDLPVDSMVDLSIVM